MVTGLPAVAQSAPFDARAHHLSQMVVRVCSALLVAVGLVVLLGWWLDIASLKSLRPGLASMKANTAAGFLLAGVALAELHRRRWPDVGWPTIAIGTLVALLGGLTLVQYGAGIQLGLDEVLARDPGSALTSSPGRMAPFTALAFLLMGAALALTARPSKQARAGAQALALLTMVLCLFVLISYLYGAHEPFGLHRYTQVAFHTLAAFLILGGGLLATTPEVGLSRLIASDTSGGLLARLLMPACLVAPVGLGAVRLWGQRAGFYDTELGLALFATSNLVVLSAVVAWTARVVTNHEALRLVQEAALQVAYGDLERRIADRVADLRESEQRYRTLARNLPNGAMLLFDHDLRYLVADGAELLAALGLPKEQLEGKTLFDIVTPQNEAQMVALYRATLAGETSNVELAQGDRSLAIHLAPVRGNDGVVSAGMVLLYDITALKRAEAARQRSEQQFRRLVEAMPDNVVVIRDQRFVYVNPAAVKTLATTTWPRWSACLS